MSLTAIILTYNEEIHLRRCLESVFRVADRVVVIDSGSTDRTVDIACEMGAEVYRNPWVNYARQFRWALENVNIRTDWVMRVDADEVLLPELIEELRRKLPLLPAGVSGLFVNMRVYFMDRWIKHGYYPMKLLRIWRNGKGEIQQKWMDEHIVLSGGETLQLEGDMADHNLNTLSWWTAKHNRYALREAVDRLHRKYGFLGASYDTGYAAGRSTGPFKSMYMRLPLFVRPFLYFCYRYFVRLGFLDGKKGLIWHVLQGFWCQFLIDAMIYQIEHRARRSGRSVRQVIEEDFEFPLS